MKMKCKKLFTASMVVITVAALLCGCSKRSENKQKLLGICQYGEHESLDNCREGLLEGLKESGLEDAKDFFVIYQNAGYDDKICTQIAKNFSAKNVVLMCGIATNAATACFEAARETDIPVVFTAVTDPVCANLTNGNITGTSDKLPVEAQLDLIRKLQPEARKIGIIYTRNEPNSVSAIKEYEEKAEKFGFVVDAIGVTARSEVSAATDILILRHVDCFSNLTDNSVVGVLPTVLEKTNAARIPVYGSEVEQVKHGCVASAGIDYFELGKQTGALAAQIIKGEKNAADIPYLTITEYNYYINSSVMAAFGLTVPSEIAEKAIESGQR